MVEWEELSKLIKTRRSIRKFQDKPVPEELLVKTLELATWAPNGGNQQAWKFLIVTNSELIQKMGDAVNAKTVCIAVLMGRYSSVADQILRARGETDAIAREIRSYRETGKSSLQSAASAITYICLILHYFGLANTWMGGPLQAKKEIETLLEVTPEWDFVGLIPVGYAAEAPETRPRKPIQDVIRFIR
jgi:nitroreductase